jgi:hypothetical protein
MWLIILIKGGVMDLSKPQCVNEQIVSRIIGIKPKTLQNWRSLGRGPAYLKLGGKVVYSLDDLRKWLESRRVEPEE